MLPESPLGRQVIDSLLCACRGVGTMAKPDRIEGVDDVDVLSLC